MKSSGPPAGVGAVYLGDEWLIYASAQFQFDWSEFVAPGFVFGLPPAGLTLSLQERATVSGTLLLHAGGVWSELGDAMGGVLYLDPLTPAGTVMQRIAAGTVSPRTCPAVAPLGEFLPALCAGNLGADHVRDWVDALTWSFSRESSTTPVFDPRLADLRVWLRHHREGRVDVAAMSRRVGLSPDHLRQRFRRRTGLTMSSYLAWLRLFSMAEQACEAALSNERGNAALMMQEAGFYDASHGSRSIRRYFALTPAEMLGPGRFVDCRSHG